VYLHCSHTPLCGPWVAPNQTLRYDSQRVHRCMTGWLTPERRVDCALRRGAAAGHDAQGVRGRPLRAPPHRVATRCYGAQVRSRDGQLALRARRRHRDLDQQRWTRRQKRPGPHLHPHRGRAWWVKAPKNPFETLYSNSHQDLDQQRWTRRQKRPGPHLHPHRGRAWWVKPPKNPFETSPHQFLKTKPAHPLLQGFG
jgi:hypothetical protein